MNVPSYQFLAFAAAVAIAINVSSKAGWRRAIFLLANLAFLAFFYQNALTLAPFAGFIALGFICVKLMERQKSSAVFVSVIAVLLIAFCWLKQYLFIPHGLFLTYAYFTVGMSYIFFRMLHVTIDAFQDTMPCKLGLIEYLNYTLNFTSIASGPIQFYKDYLANESQPAATSPAIVGRATERIIVGLFKVSIMSPLFANAQDRGLTALLAATTLEERIAYAAAIVILFPVYLYVNFSGYMDFVIGIARFLRFELPENFDRPFLARGYIEFWGRWHMTLSNWLKTYVFSTLLITLMRRWPSARIEPFLGVFVYFVTFFLVGVWHGQTTMFLMFGVLQGLGVSLNKLYQITMLKRLGRRGYRALCDNGVYEAVSRGLTFTWFALSLLFFWSSWAQLAHLFAALGFAAAVGTTVLVLAAVSAGLAALQALTAAWDRKRAATTTMAGWLYLRTATAAVLLVVTISITVALNAPAPHIVYKAF